MKSRKKTNFNLRRCSLIYHLGVLHFLPTFLLAGYYFLHQGGWLGFGGFCLIMFAGVGIDSDHYFGKKAAPRRQEIWLAVKRGKITFGTVDPTGGVNFFHSLIGLLCVLAVGLLIMHIEILLGALFLNAYYIHMLVVDSLDCDNQNVPTNPLPVSIHLFFWDRFQWFRWMCFNKHLLPQ